MSNRRRFKAGWDEEREGLDYFEFTGMTSARDVAVAGAQLVEAGIERIVLRRTRASCG